MARRPRSIRSSTAPPPSDPNAGPSVLPSCLPPADQDQAVCAPDRLPPPEPWLMHRRLRGRPELESPWLDQDWLLTNGTGTFAMGTPAAINVRRYHALLVAATQPPVGRIVLVNQILEQLLLERADGTCQIVDFSSLLFRDERGQWVFSPAGHRWLQSFEKGAFARWTYVHQGLRLIRQLYLHWQDQATTLRYQLNFFDPSVFQAAAAAPLRRAIFRLAPMLTLRDFHGLVHCSDGLPIRSSLRSVSGGHILSVRRGPWTVTLACNGPQGLASFRNFYPQEQWWYNVFYPIEADRGLDCTEDYFVPGAFEVPLDPAGETGVSLSIALGERPADPWGWTIDDRCQELEPVIATLGSLLTVRGPDAASSAPAESSSVSPADELSQLARTLALAADDFLAQRRSPSQTHWTILAGFPWFADWGRDTFIALPGLLLCTGRLEQARSVLQLFAQHIRDGLVPNCFDDYNPLAAHYNSADASLWFIRAALEYLAFTDDRDSWDDWLGPACLSIMDAYIHGTQHGIRVAGDGLLTVGESSGQLTWMDAAAGGVPFTPRPGKVVELNALWYHALLGLAALVDHLAWPDRRAADHYLKLAERMKRSFVKVFWDERLGYLRDCVWVDAAGQEHIDASLRPNQIFTVSLPHSPLPRTKQLEVLNVVRQHLLTPMGLRTLAPSDPRYQPHYRGNAFQRDSAYHQGTVWPWLMGPFAEAVLRTGDFSPQARQEARRLIQPLLDHMLQAGWGQLHEIFDAEPGPDGRQRPNGCPAQAWSVAELLRILHLINKS